MCIPFPSYCALSVLGLALACFLSPWFLIINCYIIPVLRFNYWASFSVLAFDCTFGTKDGGLHMAGGPIIHLTLAPIFFAIEAIESFATGVVKNKK